MRTGHGWSFALANSSIRRLRRRARRVSRAVDDRADGFRPLVLRQAQLVEPAAAGILRCRIGSPGGLAGAFRDGSKQATLGACARKQRSDRSTRRQAGSEDDERSFFDRLAGATTSTAD